MPILIISQVANFDYQSLKLIHLFAREVLLVKKLEIEETKTTWKSTFKTDMIKVGLVFLISNFFITKTSLANKWTRKKIPSCSNSALVEDHVVARPV
jgi:hypothetical protein